MRALRYLTENVWLILALYLFICELPEFKYK